MSFTLQTSLCISVETVIIINTFKLNKAHKRWGTKCFRAGLKFANLIFFKIFIKNAYKMLVKNKIRVSEKFKGIKTIANISSFHAWGIRHWTVHRLIQCFSTGVPRNLRVPRVAARGSAETDRNYLGRNLQLRFYGVVAI